MLRRDVDNLRIVIARLTAVLGVDVHDLRRRWVLPDETTVTVAVAISVTDRLDALLSVSPLDNA